MKVFLLILVASFCLSSQLTFSQNVTISKMTQEAIDKVDKEKIKSHVSYLADDKLKGRLPGEPGFQMAIDYVTDQFVHMGLLPAGENGTYLQKLLLRTSTLNSNLSSIVIKDKIGNEDSLSLGKDIMLMPNAYYNSIYGEAPLVFVGYGIEIPGIYSDYNGVSVKGKIVIFLNGIPDSLTLPSTLMAHFANASSKMEIAASKGAIGAIIAPATNTVLRGSTSSITVAMNPEKSQAFGRAVAGNLKMVARLPYPILQRLFMYGGKSLQKSLADLKKAKPSSFDWPVSVKFRCTSSFKDITSYNVVGKIEGGDEVLKDEYVVHTAHLDHLGVGTPVNGDSIYNGAHDNASGVASLLEIARLYTMMGSKPRRSILVVLVTAEEMGLLGSAYFAGHPTVLKSQIVADVNTDMPTLIAPLLSVAPLGAEHSSLAKNVAFACKQLGIEVQKDPMPEEVRFIRSDQYSFVLQGIPALHIKYGIKTNDPSFDLVKFTKEWRDKNYHKPSDEITNNFNFDAARKYVQLNFLISYSVAQTTERPKWNEGDFFAK